MNIVITTGNWQSDLESVSRVLACSGVASSTASRREGLTAQEIHRALLATRGYVAGGRPPDVQLVAGTLWHELASDLILANLEQSCWGWMDRCALWLTDFWLAFESQICFVLVYCSPSVALGRAMATPESANPSSAAAALQQWCSESKSMLSLTMRYPDRCVLMHEASVHEKSEQLVSEVNNAFGLQLQVSNASNDGLSAQGQATSSLAALLASTAIDAVEDSLILFHELEGCAHLPSSLAETLAFPIEDAWSEYRSLNQQLHEARLKRDELAVRLQDAVVRLSELTLAEADLRSQCEVLARERDEYFATSESNANALAAAQILARNAERARDEIQAHFLNAEADAERVRGVAEKVVYELHAAHLETESSFTRAQTARAELAAMTEARSQSDSRLQAAIETHLLERASLMEQLNSCRRNLADRDAELHASTAAIRDAIRQRDLVRLQVLQLGSEIRRGEDIRIAETDRLRGLVEAARRWRTLCWQQQAPELAVDLREKIEGSNWYDAELDGRWTGPSQVSTLRIPALAPGRYGVQVHVVGSMATQLIDESKLSINEIPVSMSRSGKKHPYVLSGEFIAVEPPCDVYEWLLILIVSQTISPADQGSPDQRRLGLRVGHIKFTLLRRD